MKVIKFLSFIALVVFFASCEKESLTDVVSNATDTELIADVNKRGGGESVPTEDLPMAITEYITANYPEASIIKVKLKNEEYKVYLDNFQKVYFDLEGNFLREGMSNGNGHFGGGEMIAVEDLPMAVTNYVTMNYPEANIVKVKLKNDEYKVYLDISLKVYFDLEGNFLREEMSHSGGSQEIAAEELPTVITDYIAENYPEANIESARVSSRGYKVRLDNNIKVYFDLDGNFVKEKGFDNDEG